jgi:2'-5' RNA ligase
MKKTIAIAYWLTPAEPERELFAEIIRVLATELDAPLFEPHLTICVTREETQRARETLKQIAAAPIRMRVRDVHCSNRFTKTLFVRFQRNRAFDDLGASLRRAAKIPAGMSSDPHLSLLYKKVSARAKEDLISAIRLPFSEVAFDSMSAVRCAVPIRDRADVEAWQTVATRSLRS